MRGVAKSFGAVRALDGVELQVRRGEVHALVGENGAGKSTLMKILAGALEPDAGAMRLDEEPYRPRGPLDASRSGVAMIYQELNLAPHLSVLENVMLGREDARLGVLRRRSMRDEVLRALEVLDHPEITPEVRVGDLGPGARQLVEIARALVGRELRVLVLDEPTSSLSRRDTERLFELVERLRLDGVAIVYISHFLEEVQRIADRYTVLRDGRTVGTGRVHGTPLEEIVQLMAGRKLDEVYSHSERQPGEVVLALEGLGGVPLPRSASFELRRGEILGLAGLVGAGRTELVRTLFGLEPVRTGTVRLASVASTRGGPRRRLAQGIGLLSEDRQAEGLALGLTIAENTTLSRLRPFTLGPWLRRRAQERATAGWIERLGIRCHDARQEVGQLSGGNQQKVALARLLHHDVDVLLLDEPTRGVDVTSKVEIYRLMGELAERGKALLMVSSYLPELLGVCDRIAVMHRGVLGPARPRDEWSETSLLDEATRGVSA